LTGDRRTVERIRADIESERVGLAEAVEELRGSLHEATDLRGRLRPKLPLFAAAAAGAGFVLGGGLRATLRALFRRRR